MRTVKLWLRRTIPGCVLAVSCAMIAPALADPPPVPAHRLDVGCLAFSPDGNLLASGSDDRTVKLWSVPEGKLQVTLSGHSGSVQSVAFSPDGRLLASGSYDETVKLWSVPEGKLQATLEGHSDGVNSVAFSPDGKLLPRGATTRP